ncbi:MAG: electron transfer flavoprotein subunit alpha [Deltaproteobacteria bacterium]|nr:electron transfer flavoprotein subunit alpha [Deltaproteobacteria bacterium]
MILFDPEKCTGCGSCLDICPTDAIELIDEKAVINEDECQLCGSCEAACETGAITIESEESEEKGESGVDLSQYRGVWIIAEQRKGCMASVVYQLLGKGRELADALDVPLAVVVIGFDMRDQVESLAGYGADTVYYINHSDCADFNDELYTDILVDIINKYKPEIVLSGATAIGRSLIPGVATRLETGLTADCTQLEIDPEKNLLLQTRPAYGGHIMATIVCPNHRPQMATVRPNVMKKPQVNPDAQSEIVEIPFDPSAYSIRTKLVEHICEGEGEGTLLSDADIVVAGGRALKNTENFELIRTLAGLLGGAVGASRPPIDSEWMPYRHQIGQTGKTVCPKLYIACGISGAVQHLVGMESSEVIVAINKDRSAPIFEVATYGIEGDIFEVLPALIKRLKER